MADVPFFSVIIPVHNGSEFLGEAIQSVIDQSFSNWELIIVDDGSKDKSYEISKTYEASDERIKVFTHPDRQNLGVSASRNRAVEESKADWIAFLDADDIWLPEKLAENYNVIQNHDDLAVIYSHAGIIKDGFSGEVEENKYIFGTPGVMNKPFLKTLKGVRLATPSVVMNKEVFRKTGGFDEQINFSEDTLLYHKALLFGDLYCIDKSLIKVRYHDHSCKSVTEEDVISLARLKVYLKLLEFNSAEPYRESISLQAATTGMARPWKSFMRNPWKNSPVIIKALKKVNTSEKMYFRHKLVSYVLPIHLLMIKTGLMKRN